MLGRGENFANPQLLDQTERDLAGWTADFTMITWNPPWLLSLLLPFTLISFQRAAWLWLLFNVGLIFAGAVLVWLTYAKEEQTRRRFWLIVPFAFLFFPPVSGVILGQVNILVFFGLALFLYLEDRNHLFSGAAALALTTIKPHLVYVTLPILVLQALYRRKWRFIVGLALPVVVLTLFVFVLRPTFLGEYFQTTNGGNLLGWQTPTIGGILDATFGWQWTKLMGLIILPVMIVWWWISKQELKTAQLVQITLIISVMTAPFGWTYDQIVLLIPLLQIVVWVIDGRYLQIERVALLASLVVLYAMIWFARIQIESEVEMFWIPIAIGVVYTWAFWRRENRELELVVS
ncbi:MAG: glycosyltransferase family 87 protein [Candidatus Promineifilaceae bacterium]